MNYTAIAGLETWLSQQIIGQADLVKNFSSPFLPMVTSW